MLVTVTFMSRRPSPTTPNERSTGDISMPETDKSWLSISITEIVSYWPSQPKLSLQPPNLQFLCATTISGAEFGPPASWPTSAVCGLRPAAYDRGLRCPPLPSERVT